MSAKKPETPKLDDKKPSLHLVGGKGAPTIKDIEALYKSITGKDPTPEDLEASKKMLEEHIAKVGHSTLK